MGRDGSRRTWVEKHGRDTVQALSPSSQDLLQPQSLDHSAAAYKPDEVSDDTRSFFQPAERAAAGNRDVDEFEEVTTFRQQARRFTLRDWVFVPAGDAGVGGKSNA